MEISVNGQAKTVGEAITVSGLLQELGLTTGRIAVELNREIVPRAEHATTRLAAGDKVEVVSFVGGG